MNRNKLLAGLTRLAAPESAPFDELETRNALVEWLTELKFPFEVDRFGNTLVRIRHGHPRRQVAFVAHLDHPAFRVMSVKGPLVTCRAEGGVPARGVRGAKVVFPKTAEGPVLGTIDSVKTKGGDRPRTDVATVRIGARVPPPKIGEFGVFSIPALKRAGNRLKMRAADDLAGVAAIVGGLADLSKGSNPVDVTAMFTRAEEVGFHGSIALAIEGKIPRDTTIVSVECSEANDNIKLGKGPVVRLGDRSGPFAPQSCALVRGAAENTKKLTFQKAMLTGGSCEATAFTVFGFDAAGIALPLLCYHNQGPRGVAAEEIDLRDLEGAVQLIVATAERAGAGVEDLDLLRNELVLSSTDGRERLREPIDPITGYPRAARF
ncbi:MAG: hypothetical protein A2289_06360 [Deltaproteobacteria bacterium RIFOXYA12_FULL_58_15]|nr:MAG: hypothetical protein A2289_06360 [Deltaproteobacteria bacterium RIFOXYA12_FULL_58_15]OGR11685.1 MAG: hypothetical protein A2341_02385 [Deltaproteobacteria bacterium RIFOXYB12_FULL_58_9]